MTDGEAGEETASIQVRMPQRLLDRLDAHVEKLRVGANVTTRASLIRYWIERGLNESVRPR